MTVCFPAPLSAACSGGWTVPVVLDVDWGHVPPHPALVNGARAELEVDGEVQRLTQTLA